VSDISFSATIRNAFDNISAKFHGVELYKTASGRSIILPEHLVKEQEVYFAIVTEKFLEYLKNSYLPAWELPDMTAIYFTTIRRLEHALKNKD